MGSLELLAPSRHESWRSVAQTTRSRRGGQAIGHLRAAVIGVYPFASQRPEGATGRPARAGPAGHTASSAWSESIGSSAEVHTLSPPGPKARFSTIAGMTP